MYRTSVCKMANPLLVLKYSITASTQCNVSHSCLPSPLFYVCHSLASIFLLSKSKFWFIVHNCFSKYSKLLYSSQQYSTFSRPLVLHDLTVTNRQPVSINHQEHASPEYRPIKAKTNNTTA